MFDEKHKERKKVIDEYLVSKGHPKKSAEFVFNELPNIWKLLHEKDLAPKGMSFQEFAQHVHNAYLMVQFDL